MIAAISFALSIMAIKYLSASAPSIFFRGGSFMTWDTIFTGVKVDESLSRKPSSCFGGAGCLLSLPFYP
jgi:hypothetical protein